MIEKDKPEKQLIIPIFIMNSGCPRQCLFCNQKISAGNFAAEITKDIFDAEVTSYLQWNKDNLRSVEIAFYGGSFTALDAAYQKRLLSWAHAYIQKGKAASIRISTRPDYIDDDQLNLLRSYGVDTIEIGAQSFNDEALRFARRGHDAWAIVRAVRMTKAHGFKTGLHLMAGLPHDSREGFIESLERTVELRPDTARIHPVLVFQDTPLADEFREGRYLPLGLDEAVDLCRLAWLKLTPAGIRIIRFGLHLTPEMSKEGAVLAGPIHPAFGSWVYSAIYYAATLKLLHAIPSSARTLHFHVADRDLSHFRGFGNQNVAAIKKLYPDCQIVIDSVPAGIQGRISLTTETGKSLLLDIPGIL